MRAVSRSGTTKGIVSQNDVLDACGPINCSNRVTAVIESYITHIRVQEDAQFPQSPPPPDSPPQNKKDRVIIVSVKDTGRVRIHKARENNNLSFSIGKTWNMDDFSTILSFSNLDPRNDEEVQWKQWAADTGFIVTIGKAYYWQANTPKEKEFFIASLVKIYKKYTKGKAPELIGFSPREEEQILGETGKPRDRPSARGPPLATSQNQEYFKGVPIASPDKLFSKTQTPDSKYDQGGPSPSDARAAFASQKSPSNQGPSPLGVSSSNDSRSQLGPQRGRDQPIRNPPSREQMRPTGRITPQSSRSDVDSQREPTPDSLGIRGTKPPLRSPERSQPFDVPIDAIQIGDEDSTNGLGLSRDQNNNSGTSSRTRERLDLNGSNTSLPNDSRGAVDEQSKAPLPERRRPPMLINGSQQNVPGSLKSPRQGAATAAASQDSLFKASRSMPGGFYPSPAPSAELENDDGLLPAPLQPSPKFRQDELKRPSPAVSAEPEPKDATTEQAPAVKAPSPQPPSQEEKKEAGDETARPGLGRMFGNNKKTTRDLFQKAATAYTAFKPRAGGAAARLRAQDSKSPNEPDGISGVVPAPRRTDTDDSNKPSSVQTTPVDAKQPQPTPLTTAAKDSVPDVTVTSPISPVKSAEPQDLSQQIAKAALIAQQQRAKLAEEEAARRRKRRSTQQAKYLSILGVDASLFEGRGLDFEMALDDFGWNSGELSPKNIDALETEIRREISRVEAGSWLGHLDQKDERVEAVEKLLDRAIAECDELEGLLTVYNVELSSLNDDIAFIEAQSQGLQVHTANQKLLQSELHALVETISITPQQLEALRRASPSSTEGLEDIESSLMTLYKAMVTIDPTIKQQSEPNNKRISLALAGSDLSPMSALQEKRETYMNEAKMFIDRLKQFMDMKFGAALLETHDAINQRRTSIGPSTKLSAEHHDVGRNALWRFSPLVLFVKEIDTSSWEVLLRSYQARAKPIYQDEFRDNIQLFKRSARKAIADEAAELLFTYNEKESPDAGLTGAARKLTVKRSQTLAKSLRSASSEKAFNRPSSNLPNGSTSGVGSLWPFEVFASALDEMTPLIFTEQNFIVDFFHAGASSSTSQDFADAVTAAPPESRKGTNLYARIMFEADRAMARRISDIMESLFECVPSELQSLIDWALKADALQGIGILHALQRTLANLEDTNQDFLTRTLSTLSQRLTGLWNKFIDEQIRAIEETKVRIKKRKGVISFIRVFPNFSAAIENMLPSSAEEPPASSEVRAMVEKAYARINKAMFESLRVIAKDSPGVGHGAAAGLQGMMTAADPEDKEALNYHILLIENMNHYVEEVDERGDEVLAEGRRRAGEEEEEHLGRYVDAVVRRPLGKVLVRPSRNLLSPGSFTDHDLQDFTESLDHLLSLLSDTASPSSLSNRTSTSKTVFKKLIASHDSKELRRGIEALRKRVEKHFGEADEAVISRGLVSKVWKACEERYIAIAKRVDEIGRDVYDGEGMPWVEEKEIERWFRSGR